MVAREGTGIEIDAPMPSWINPPEPSLFSTNARKQVQLKRDVTEPRRIEARYFLPIHRYFCQLSLIRSIRSDGDRISEWRFLGFRILRRLIPELGEGRVKTFFIHG